MVTRARLALYRSLSRARNRREEGLYVVEGRRLVSEALLSGAPLATILVTAQFAGTEAGGAVADLAAKSEVEVEAVPAKEIHLIADTKTPQGVIGIVRAPESNDGCVRPPGLILALDRVADPGNAGTLVRAADAFGVAGVLFGSGCADPHSPKTLRAAMGSNFHVPVETTDDLVGRLGEFREAGATVLVATLDGGNLYRVKTDAACVVLVLGSEAHGVAEAVRAVADRVVTVPCPGRAESLNVAMAGAVALSYLAGRDQA